MSATRWKSHASAIAFRSGSLSFFTTLSFSAIAVRMFTRLGISDLNTRRLTVRLEWPIDIVPGRPVMLLVIHANIIGPPCRLHKQHHVAVGNGNILKPRLPLVRVPGMFLNTALTFSMVGGFSCWRTW